MKKKVLSTFIISLGFTLSFAQNGIVGTRVSVSENREYLRVDEVLFGLPAEIGGIRTGDRIYLIDNKKVADLENPVSHVQGSPGTYVMLAVKRFGREQYLEFNIPRIAVGNNYISERELAARIQSNDFSTNPKGSVYGQSLSLLHDASKDMFRYRTFDFDYSSVENPLLEKELLRELGRQLEARGIMRSEENPDLVIVISFFEGKREQYVPPQQIISTRIKQSYNLFWGYIPVPVTESIMKDGYTQTTYLATISLKFLEAASMEESKVPPVVWSGSVSRTGESRLLLTELSREYFDHMLYQFPEVFFKNSERYFARAYAYTGIIYNKNSLQVVGEVIPGSPAYEAGIRRGDQIVSINGYRLYSDYNEPGSNKWSNMAYGGAKSGLRYLYIFSDLVFKPYKDEVKTLTIKIKRDGMSMEFNVLPERRWNYILLKS